MRKNKPQTILTAVYTLWLSAAFALPAYSQTTNANTSTGSTTPLQAQQTTTEQHTTITNPNSLSIEELNRAIEEKADQRKQLQQQLERYQSIVAEKQKASASLANEMQLLDSQIQKTELDVESLSFAIEEKQLEIVGTQKQIDLQNQNIDKQLSYLAELIRTIHRYDQQDPLEQLVTHDSFSEIVNDLRTTASLETQVGNKLTSLKDTKANLEREMNDREVRKRELEALQQEVNSTAENLASQKEYKINLLTETKQSEQQYSSLLEQSKQEQLAADSDIRTLEETVKAKLNPSSNGTNEDFSTFTGNRNVQLTWPITPDKGISAYFHDPTYPYRKYFEHPAIDIPAPQGTAIMAPDDGYVARAKNAGMGYSYILLVHSNSISTVYGHVIQINIAEDTFVKKGQVIGLSGGMPGTPGAGRLTTGPHLHFEVRLNGIPVNPLDYLP
jgi:murein DD-endopeptidase MepM/ murein hydrolase activator NlpD